MVLQSRRIEAQSAVTELKCVKNEAELDGMRRCHVRDATALCQYLCWLENAVGRAEVGSLTISFDVMGTVTLCLRW